MFVLSEQNLIVVVCGEEVFVNYKGLMAKFKHTDQAISRKALLLYPENIQEVIRKTIELSENNKRSVM